MRAATITTNKVVVLPEYYASHCVGEQSGIEWPANVPGLFGGW